MDLVENASNCLWKISFVSGAVNNRDAVAIDAEVAPAWVDDLKPIALLFSYVTRPQLICIEEFNDLTFEEHEKISIFDKN